MSRDAEINELLRKAMLRPGEVMACLGVTKNQLRAIREARPDAWIRYPGTGHDRWRSDVVRELMGGCGDNKAENRELKAETGAAPGRAASLSSL